MTSKAELVESCREILSYSIADQDTAVNVYLNLKKFVLKRMTQHL